VEDYDRGIGLYRGRSTSATVLSERYLPAGLTSHHGQL
jgi:hypothetical protein